MPSTVVGNGVEGTGGYEGQGSPSRYTLSANRPFIVTMEIRDTVSNPLEREGKNVDEFSDGNGGRLVYGKEADDKDANRRSSDRSRRPEPRLCDRQTLGQRLRYHSAALCERAL